MKVQGSRSTVEASGSKLEGSALHAEGVQQSSTEKEKARMTSSQANIKSAVAAALPRYQCALG